MKEALMNKVWMIVPILGAFLLAFPVAAADRPDMVGLSNTVLELSVQNQTLKSQNLMMTGEKEVAEAKLDACEEKLTKNIIGQVESQKEVDACAAALSRIDQDKLEQKKILDKLREENRRLDEQNRLLLKGMDKSRDMGAVIEKSSRVIMGLGDEKTALAVENERLIKMNAALELKVKETIKKAEAIVSRKAADLLKIVPRKIDVPRYVKDLKIKNAELGARNLKLTRMNEELERSSKDFFIKSNALKDRADNNKSLADALKTLKHDYESLKKENAQMSSEYTVLRDNLDVERASIYREAAAAYVKQEFFVDAIDAYLESLKLDPKDALTYYYLGILYSKTGEEGRAMEYLRKYLKIYPKAENKAEVLYIMSLLESPGPEVIR